MNYAVLFSLILVLGKISGVLGISWFWAMFPLVVTLSGFLFVLTIAGLIGMCLVGVLISADKDKVKDVWEVLKATTNDAETKPAGKAKKLKKVSNE
jgi:hypothetical protein